jgi:hypothetical protein
VSEAPIEQALTGLRQRLTSLILILLVIEAILVGIAIALKGFTFTEVNPCVAVALH